MRRFAQAYLTIAAVIIVLANLILILLYGRQFLYRAESTEVCSPMPECQSSLLSGDLVSLNLILIGVFLVIWFIFAQLHSAHTKRS